MGNWLRAVAIAGAAVAIVFLVPIFPIWVSHVIFVVLGLGCAGLFAWYNTQDHPTPAQLERSRRLGYVAVLGLTLGTSNPIGQFLSGSTSYSILWIPVISTCVIGIGFIGIDRWHSIATRGFSERQSVHADFDQDAEGNSIPAAARQGPHEEIIDTWDDLVRAQQRKRGSTAEARTTGK